MATTPPPPAHSTGGPTPDYKTIQVPFDRFVITLRLTAQGEFVDILQVALNKDFLSYRQQLQSRANQDVTDTYEP